MLSDTNATPQHESLVSYLICGGQPHQFPVGSFPCLHRNLDRPPFAPFAPFAREDAAFLRGSLARAVIFSRSFFAVNFFHRAFPPATLIGFLLVTIRQL
jgi:hypothetical protein